MVVTPGLIYVGSFCVYNFVCMCDFSGSTFLTDLWIWVVLVGRWVALAASRLGKWWGSFVQAVRFNRALRTVKAAR
jgi:hypothetical protein